MFINYDTYYEYLWRFRYEVFPHNIIIGLCPVVSVLGGRPKGFLAFNVKSTLLFCLYPSRLRDMSKTTLLKCFLTTKQH